MSSPVSSSTRRSFIQAILAAGAAPLILPSHVWGADTPVNDKVRLGFIGIGTMGRSHLGSYLKRPEFHVAAVCDVDTSRREDSKNRVVEEYSKASGSEYKGCEMYADFRELLARKDIDAVVIATPDHWHAYIAIAAIKAGKDVYCEKPLTQTIHEARTLVNTVRASDRVFQTGSQQRSSREFRIACELVRNGAIGNIVQVEAGFGAPGKWCDLPEEAMEPGLNWDMWLGPAPMRPYHSILSPRGVHKHFPAWRNFREYGSGMITDWGAHHLDIAQWGLGMDESGPVKVVPAEKPETAKAGGQLIYANGVTVTHVENNGVTFHGSDGFVFVNRGKFTFVKGDKEVANVTKAGPEEKPLKVQLDLVEKEYLADAKVKLYASEDHKGDWFNCIKSRKRPICDVEVGARTVTACHLLGFSYYNGQTFQWDPATNQFAGGTGNPEWLTRPYRDQWKVV